MSLPPPTHRVTMYHAINRAACSLLCFDLAEAEFTLEVYRRFGWSGVIEALDACAQP